jgi:hypothetical protein
MTVARQHVHGAPAKRAMEFPRAISLSAAFSSSASSSSRSSVAFSRSRSLSRLASSAVRPFVQPYEVPYTSELKQDAIAYRPRSPRLGPGNELGAL